MNHIRPSLSAALIALGLVVMAMAGACGGSNSTASKPTPSTTVAKAPCTTDAVLVSIRAKYDSAKSKVTLPSNTDLVCASGFAKITVFIAIVPTPANGPLGAIHLVLLEDQFGQWVIANSILCNSSGQPTRSLPAKLGTVCGVQ